MSTDITFVLTSCGRFDLLAETLRTFVACDAAPIARYVVAEDPGDASVRDALTGLGIDVDVVVNETRLGRTRPPGRVAPPAPRNDPCPRGSGERYKRCHGLAA